MSILKKTVSIISLIALFTTAFLGCSSITTYSRYYPDKKIQVNEGFLGNTYEQEDVEMLNFAAALQDIASKNPEYEKEAQKYFEEATYWANWQIPFVILLPSAFIFPPLAWAAVPFLTFNQIGKNKTDKIILPLIKEHNKKYVAPLQKNNKDNKDNDKQASNNKD